MKIAEAGGTITGAYVTTVQRIYDVVAAVHRISPVLARQRPNQLQIRLYHDWVDLLSAWCHLEASVGSTVPVKV